ncbi:hypothetical protein L486_01642 [Kwoniella mangroviensis CBS 10435]|uniref:Proteasome activator PA28 C-terminal domain-containing protein n=1 Tax=Kwoniella mangroviensis CBS 10435 TaxID=1331196 RepID=A0A1B9J2F4_9TREE|nr:hypothetical protein L486_01642 [Kwoniella mangroviensis CBS 10435]
MPRFGSTLPKMDEVFKSHPDQEVIKELITARRLRAIDILQYQIPAKIVEIQKLIDQEEDPSSPFYKGQVFEVAYTDPKILQPSEMTQRSQPDREGELGKEKLVLPQDITKPEANDGEGLRMGPHWFEVVQVNPVQVKCMEIVTQELEDLHMLAQDLKVWLEMEIPVIEDGNSFGADVQAHLISQLTDAYKKSNSMQNGVRAHHADRLKLAMDWAKFPNFQDFAGAIAASDRFDHFLLRSYLRSILTLYGGLLTKFERNWSKVINPKGSHETGGMY